MNSRVLHNVYILKKLIDRKIKNMADIRSRANCNSIFMGIGGCSRAELQTFIPEEGKFETETIEGMLELINFTGNLASDSGQLFHHTHAVFSYKEGNDMLKRIL